MSKNLKNAELHVDDPLDGHSKVYVLSIAINGYKSPKVSNLMGCLNDSLKLKNRLQEKLNLPEDHYLTLFNEQATRSNILHAFRTHFGKLQNGDTAILHYSGHGSWEETSPEFVEAKLEPFGGHNEVLVVHDYGEEGVRNIADKELRWLIHELQYTDTETMKDIKFIGLMDCCFSGTIFREEEMEGRIRRTNLEDDSARPLEEYLEGQYVRQKENVGYLSIPQANFLLFSACGPDEYALEGKNGGLFSQALGQLIDNSSVSDLSYANAFYHLRMEVQRKSRNQQNPYFEYVGAVNPFQLFLGKKQMPVSVHARLFKNEDQWMTNLGILHGLKTDQWKDSQLPVYTSTDARNPCGYAKVDTIGLEHTIVTIQEVENSTEDTELFLAIHGLPFHLKLEVSSEAKDLQQLFEQELLKKGLKSQVYLDDLADYHLKIWPAQLSLFKKDQLIIGIELNENRVVAMDFMLEKIRQIIRWEQIHQISAPPKSIINTGKIKVAFSWYTNWDETKRISIENADQEEIVVPFEEGEYIFYDIKIENKDVYPVHCYLVHLGRTYGMSQKLERFIKPLRYEDSLQYDSKANGKALAITDPKRGQTTDTFIILCSKQALYAPYVFEQEGLGSQYGKIIRLQDLPAQFRAEEPKNKFVPLSSWTLKRLNVSLKRK
ncbi:MAG: caspase family protein [Bacteroidota bacterium]